MSTFVCATCATEHDALTIFPGGICLDCYKVTPEANRPMTARDLARMWGAK